jgi:hypothetical protein
MKKRTAILLSGMLLCSIGGYVAWCFRSFYLPPPLEFVGDVSPGARKAMEEWRNTSSYAAPLKFGSSTAWWNLCHPWDCRMGDPVQVEEQPDSGLWATDISRFWGFSKTGGEWDASTAKDYGSYVNYVPHSRRIHRQGEIASRIDAMGANGATVEIVSLGRLSLLGSLVRKAEEAPDPDPCFSSIFYHYEVIGAVTVEDPQARQHLLDCLARSIREAEVDLVLPGWGITPRHGIILTMGDVRAEYLVSFDDGDGYAFGAGIDGIDGFYGFGRPPRISAREDLAYFSISSCYRDAFDAFLEKNGIEREKPEALRVNDMR